MLPCEKRQKIVKRSETETTESYRCINRDCDAYKQEVNEEACSLCPVRVYAIQSPCKDLGKPIQEPEPCDDCKPIEDSALVNALANTGGFRTKVEPEDTPDGEVPDYPPMSLQLWLYKEALKRWHAAGRPVRSDEEVDKLLKICQGCDWYDKAKKRCKGCGCRVTDGGIPVTNKLKMATEHCPHPEKKW